MGKSARPHASCRRGKMKRNMAVKFALLAPGLVFLLAMVVVPATLAQDTASLTGTVRDSSGAVIAGAAVTLKHTATGTIRELKTNSSGEYVAAALAPGHYDIGASAAGFRKYQATGVVLRVAQNARIDVALQVGSTQDEVTVHGESLAQVNTESSELGGTITGKEVVQLQLNGRNFTQLITLVPGVSDQTGQDEGVVGAQGNVNYSVNGGRTEYNNWEVDGGDMLDNGSNFSINVSPAWKRLKKCRYSLRTTALNMGATVPEPWKWKRSQEPISFTVRSGVRA